MMTGSFRFIYLFFIRIVSVFFSFFKTVHSPNSTIRWPHFFNVKTSLHTAPVKLVFFSYKTRWDRSIRHNYTWRIFLSHKQFSCAEFNAQIRDSLLTYILQYYNCYTVDFFFLSTIQVGLVSLAIGTLVCA